MSGFNPQQWSQTTVDETGNSTPPDPGTYQVVLKSAKAFTSQAGEDYVVLGFQVINGPHAEYEWDELRSFRNEGAYKAAKATCQRIGVNVENIVSLEQLDGELKQHLGNWYTVDVKQNGEYRNVYVNGRIDGGVTDVPADPAAFQTAPAVSSSDIPF